MSLKDIVEESLVNQYGPIDSITRNLSGDSPMTRGDIEADYDFNDDGRIVNPGEFEDERVYVPYFWDKYLNGYGNEDLESGIISFSPSNEEYKMFPELWPNRILKLQSDENGFVREIK
jgi:hypothetical protein